MVGLIITDLGRKYPKGLSSLSVASVPGVSENADPEIAKADQVLLGKALLRLRKDAGMTQEQAAEQMGGDAKRISRIERGQRGVRWPTLTRFLRVYATDVHALARALDEAGED